MRKIKHTLLFLFLVGFSTVASGDIVLMEEDGAIGMSAGFENDFSFLNEDNVDTDEKPEADKKEDTDNGGNTATSQNMDSPLAKDDTVNDNKITDTKNPSSSATIAEDGNNQSTIKTADPKDPNTTVLINEWVRIAEPPINATEGAHTRYESWGRAVGSTTTTTLQASGKPDDVGGRSSSEYLWSMRDRLDSVNHCKLGEYVTAKLGNQSIAHCKGRYKEKDTNIDEMLAQGRKEWREGKLDQAIGNVTKAQKLTPDDQKVNRTLTAMKKQKNDIDKKLKNTSSSIQNNKLDEAEKSLSKAAVISSKYDKYIAMKERLEDARERFEKEKIANVRKQVAEQAQRNQDTRQRAKEESRRQADEKRDAEEKLQREADEKRRISEKAVDARRQAKEQAKRNADARQYAKDERQKEVQREAKAKREAQEKQQREADEKKRISEKAADARKQAKEQATINAEARRDARIKAAEEKKRAKARKLAKKKAAEAKRRAEVKTQRDAEARRRADQNAQAKRNTQIKAQRDAEANGRAYENAQRNAQARRNAELKAQRDMAVFSETMKKSQQNTYTPTHGSNYDPKASKSHPLIGRWEGYSKQANMPKEVLHWNIVSVSSNGTVIVTSNSSGHKERLQGSIRGNKFSGSSGTKYRNGDSFRGKVNATWNKHNMTIKGIIIPYMNGKNMLPKGYSINFYLKKK